MNRRSEKSNLLPFAFGLVVMLLAVAVGGTAAPEADASALAPAAPLAPSQDDGAAVYNQSCASCHQPGGVGVAGSFPPLAGNVRVADPAYVEDVIVNGLSGPIEVDGVRYDTAMPAVDLSDDDRAAVVEYIVGLATAAPVSSDPADASAVEAIVGDPDSGRRLFIGSTAFDNGGGACASCHEAGDVGHLGGASLGPDLDDSFGNFGGEAGLAAWLAAPASATMQPIFDNEPLTEPEVADLVAFLETAPDRERPRSYGDAVLLGGIVGLIVLLGGMALARQNMNTSYTERLRNQR